MKRKGYYQIDYPMLQESLCCGEYPNGFKAYVIQKKGFSKTFASIGTRYGSIDQRFSTDPNAAPTLVPDGIAHFLEHKLFEQEDGNVLQKYAALGASPNAYTSFDKTAYLFSCTDNFGACLDLLLDYVYKPYFTDENVEKEKGIIGQEIDMYADNPDWNGYFGFLKNMFSVSPVRLEIAGTKESIAQIDKELLYQCHGTFYHPSNMILVVVGNVTPEEVFSRVAATIGAVKTKPLKIKRFFDAEPKEPRVRQSEATFDVATPRFFAGFKDFPTGEPGHERALREIGMMILFELIMGKSTPLYERLYAEGLINASFSIEYTLEQHYAFSCFAGESKNPDEAIRMILAEIETIKQTGLDEVALARILKAYQGRNIRSLDSVESIAHRFLDQIFKECILFDYFGLYERVTLPYLEDLLRTHCNPDYFTVLKLRSKGTN